MSEIVACVPSLRMPPRQPCAETSSKSSISLLEKLDFSSRFLVCFLLFHRNRIGKPGFWPGSRGSQAQKARFSPPKPGFWSGFQARKARLSAPEPGRNRAETGPKIDPQNHRVYSAQGLKSGMGRVIATFDWELLSDQPMARWKGQS